MAGRSLHPMLTAVAAACAGTCWSASSGAAASSTPLTGFLSAPTDQLAVPGMLAGAEITPEGDIYTGWAEYELRIGPRLQAWRQPTRVLPDAGLPLLSSTVLAGGVRYVQTVYAVGVAGRPVAYDTLTATNETNRSRQASLAIAVAYTRGRQVRGPHGVITGAYRYERPVTGGRDGLYDQPGRPYSATLRYRAQGRDLISSGVLLARGPAVASRPLGSAGGASPSEAHGARLFRSTLGPHGRVVLTWQIPLCPPIAGPNADRILDAVPASRARVELARIWSAQEAGMMTISLPEPKVVEAYRAAISEILASRYLSASGWVQGSNKLQYQAFWLRDASIDTYALDLAGLHAQALQNLGFLDGFQEADGLFISRAGQYDGLGQALWVLDEHARLAGAPAYAAGQLGRIGAAIGWLAAVTSADPLGLLPPSNPHDDELAYGHITGDDLWAAAGLRAAIDAAKLAGREDLARLWREFDRRFESSLERAIAAATARAGHIPPVLDSQAGRDWGNYHASYPVPVLPADSRAVSSTLAWARAHFAEGLATYAGGRSLHDYLGFSVFQTELAAGDRADAVAGLYSELAHTTATDGGWEWGIAPFGARSSPVNLAPHGTFAGDYVALLRNMLVADRAGGVSLLEGASPAWLRPGRQITVSGAPTEHGTVSFTERSTRRGETLRWSTSLAAGTPLTWTLPPWSRRARDRYGRPLGSVIALPGASGSLAVTFEGRPPRLSYALAVAKLDSAYRARGLLAPIVRARD
ncbi:MAG TPA: hypothetical protein VNZ01_03235 [Solirubrobacteraceae bacterium]|nr:hypothetical protein [Solirubrobacteraceae bacterium]